MFLIDDNKNYINIFSPFIIDIQSTEIKIKMFSFLRYFIYFSKNWIKLK